jgi:hypothetical protein
VRVEPHDTAAFFLVATELTCVFQCLICYTLKWGRDDPVRIATRYRLDGPGFESRCGVARFSAPVQTDPAAYPLSYTMSTGSSLGVKWPGRGVDHPLPSSAEVEG